MSVSVREATLDDFPMLRSLWAQADLLHHEGIPEVFSQPDDSFRTVEFLGSILSDPDQKMLVAVAQDRVVGVIRVMLSGCRPLLVPDTFATVEELIVSAEHRRKGIGRTLMEETEAWAKRTGAEELWLYVWNFNDNAIRFYESLGYQTITLRMRKSVDV